MVEFIRSNNLYTLRCLFWSLSSQSFRSWAEETNRSCFVFSPLYGLEGRDAFIIFQALYCSHLLEAFPSLFMLIQDHILLLMHKRLKLMHLNVVGSGVILVVTHSVLLCSQYMYFWTNFTVLTDITKSIDFGHTYLAFSLFWFGVLVFQCQDFTWRFTALIK